MLPQNYQVNAPLVQCAISDDDPLQLFGAVKLGRQSHTLTIYRDMVQMRSVQHYRPTELRTYFSNKTTLTEFTNRSRSNMLAKMAKARNTGPLLFITLTYRDQEWFSNTPRNLQSHLENICKRIEHNYPNAGEIWRKEWTIRKSGEHKGEVAPHIHMIVRGVGEDANDFKAWLTTAWAEVCGAAEHGATARVDCQIARSYKHAARYVSKYIAKLPDDDQELAIRFYLYLNRGEIGRHWGMRGKWDVSHSTILPMAAKQSVIFKRLVRGWLRSRNKSRFARKVARMRADYGMKILGLGDDETDVLASEVLRMWRHAGELSGWT